MQVVTSYPERLAEITPLYFKGRRSADYIPQSILRVRNHNKGLLLFLDGVENREQADDFRGQEVYIHLDDAIPLEDGEYYLFQIDGIQVVTDEGVELGRLTNVMETGANAVYIISPDEGKDILLPAIPEVILKVDVEAGVMTVHLLDGLID